MSLAEWINEILKIIIAYPGSMGYWLMLSLQFFVISQTDSRLPEGVESLIDDDARRIIINRLAYLWDNLSYSTYDQIFQTIIPSILDDLGKTDEVFRMVSDMLFNPDEYTPHAVKSALRLCDKYGWPKRIEAVDRAASDGVAELDREKFNRWRIEAIKERDLDREISDAMEMNEEAVSE